jgi:peptidoglycan hydrolase CwlO-like protein
MKNNKAAKLKPGATKADTDYVDHQAEVDGLHAQFSETLQERRNSIDEVKSIKYDLNSVEYEIRDYEASLHRLRIRARELTTLLRETVTLAQREAETLAHS